MISSSASDADTAALGGDTVHVDPWVSDLARLDELDDNQLLSLARRGNQQAYAALFERYSYSALRLARHLGQREDSDDVVSEAFAQVLDLVRRGKGPERAFRAYLFTTIRHECGRRAKARQRVMPTDDEAQFDLPVPFGNGDLDDFEKSAVRAAFESLPERWRTVLWMLDVEGHKPQDLGPALDLSANSVSALVYRARAGLRDAYLAHHVRLDDVVADSCREARQGLATYVRGTASRREHGKVAAHLDQCADCRVVHAELLDTNLAVG